MDEIITYKMIHQKTKWKKPYGIPSHRWDGNIKAFLYSGYLSTLTWKSDVQNEMRPTSGASISVPVNSLQLSRCGRYVIVIKNKLRGFGPRANYADEATAACWRSSANFCG
jgi:hypothetical protein